jgi:calcium-dependent protein kinase
MAYIANHLQSQDNQKRLRIEFAKLDQNGDGLLQKDELISAFIQLGKTPEEARVEVEAIMAKIDVNNNGTIDFSEFLTANIKMEETIGEDKLKEAFKLFDKVPNAKL